MKTSEFSYRLPPELIAQRPINPRDHSRLFIVKAKTFPVGAGPCARPISHTHFYDLPRYLKRGDVLVFNDTKVFPARLLGRKSSGGKIEALLLEQKTPDTWSALLRPGHNAVRHQITLGQKLKATVTQRLDDIFTLRFNCSGIELDRQIDQLGQAPTPPYIKTVSNLKEYQTIYARHRGSAAAPTAGFHFTPTLLEKIKKQGIHFEYVTLHVGLGTFQPVKEKEIEKHKIHSERYAVTPATWQRLLQAKKEGRRIIAVGTTTCRVLETLSSSPVLSPGPLQPHLPSTHLAGTTDIFITPGYHFKMTNALITNFHLPQSTLLMLVAAFIGDKLGNPDKGIKLTKKIYDAAVKQKYRFYSFGDAMLIA